MSGGGSAPAAPSTTTQIQDVPAWEQTYLTDVMGQAQAEAAQPYNPYTGPQVAGFTPDQTQAFSNIEGMGNQVNPTIQSGLDSANAGAATAGNIYNAGAGNINASTSYNPLAAVSPYLGAASTLNSAAAAQPYLNQSQAYNAAAAGVATPQGIQSYLSPYTQDVVQGLQNTANQNWNQNIMPGVNNEFVGSGQFGSGRNAQVLGQAANQFQTNLNTGVANALESGYTTAGNQAATEAGILGNSANTALAGGNAASNAQTSQVSNLLNQAQAAGTATQQQASNLQNAGTALGNLTATQGASQLAAGTALGNLGQQQEQTGLEQNQALQAVGQQQQQLNQTNLNTAMQNYQNAVNYPEAQTTYLDNIIRGINPGTSTTGSTLTTPAYSTSPLSGIGGVGTTALALSGSNGQQLGTATAAKRGGLISKYADGGIVTDDDSDNIVSPLDDTDSMHGSDADDPAVIPGAQSMYYPSSANPLENAAAAPDTQPVAASEPQPANPMADVEEVKASPPSPLDNKNDDVVDSYLKSQIKNLSASAPSQTDNQRNQLLALASGMLTPSPNGSSFAALGHGLGNLQNYDVTQQKLAQENKNQLLDAALKEQTLQQGKYTVTPDQLGGFIKVNNKTGQVEQIQGAAGTAAAATDANGQPLTGDAYLKTLDPRIARTAKMVGDANMATPTGFALKSPYWQNVLAAAQQYNPNFNANQFPAVTKFNTGLQGNQTRFLNVATAHLDTLGQLATALQNGDTKAINALQNTFKDQFGQPAPTNFDTAKQIVGNEVVKAVVGAGGTGADRDKAHQVINSAKSPEQLQGAINTYKTLMSGQLQGLQQQYKASTGRDDFQTRYLTPQAISALAPTSSPAASPGAAAQPDMLAALLAEKARRQQASQ